MRVHELDLENFRCFERESFGFRARFTVMIGDNGAGKSAILDALAMTLATESRTFGSRASADFDDVRLVGSSFDRLGNPVLPASIRVRGEIREQHAEWSVEFEEGGSIGFGGPVLWTKDEVAGERTLPIIAYYSTARLASQPARAAANEKREVSRVGAYRNALSGFLDSGALVAWFRSRTGQSLQYGRADTDLEVVLEATRTALPAWNRLEFDFRADELVASRPIRPGELDRLPLGRLSDGQRVHLGLVGDLARRCAQLNGHLGQEAVRSTPGVVLIDELDLHLHPRWQRTVVDDLQQTFPSLQFIATTHSPFIVQSLPSDALIDLSAAQAHMAGGPTNEPERRDFRTASIEDITEQAMGVQLPQLSERRRLFLETARRYYTLLRGTAVDPTELEQAREEMLAAGVPFADDLAFVAYQEARTKG